MRVEHALRVIALCPVDGRIDTYMMTVRTTPVIAVEEILAVTANSQARNCSRKVNPACSSRTRLRSGDGRISLRRATYLEGDVRHARAALASLRAGGLR